MPITITISYIELDILCLIYIASHKYIFNFFKIFIGNTLCMASNVSLDGLLVSPADLLLGQILKYLIFFIFHPRVELFYFLRREIFVLIEIVIQDVEDIKLSVEPILDILIDIRE